MFRYGELYSLAYLCSTTALLPHSTLSSLIIWTARLFIVLRIEGGCFQHGRALITHYNYRDILGRLYVHMFGPNPPAGHYL